MVRIVQLSDAHLRAQGQPALRIVETNMLAVRAVAAVNALDPQPDFVIFTGDLADQGGEAEYSVARPILEQLKAPYAVIAGNHDSAADLKTCFADREWASQMPGDSLQFAVAIGDVRLIGLNSAVAGKPYGNLDDQELAWLADRLAEFRDDPVIVALHHPPIVTGLEAMDRSRLRNAAELADILKTHDKVLRVICGHVHRPITAAFGGTIAISAPGIAHQVTFDLSSGNPQTFCLEPPAFLVHAYDEVNGLVTHMAYVESYPGPYPFWPADGIVWP
ncbi:MAG: phosphodiesterase [Pseudomonadota bacterium]